MLNHIVLEFDFDVNQLRDYLLNTVMPTVKERLAKVSIVTFKHSDTQDPVMERFNQYLMTRFGTPPILSYNLFHHLSPLNIHIDGRSDLYRHANLNLPLCGWQGNIMRFYKENPGYAAPVPKEGSAIWCDPDQVTVYDEFETTEDWVLVRVDQPHNIVNMDFDNPRATLSIKFVGNPTFEELQKCFLG